MDEEEYSKSSKSVIELSVKHKVGAETDGEGIKPLLMTNTMHFCEMTSTKCSKEHGLNR